MNKKILVFIADQFDERELIYPAYRVKEEGYDVDFVGLEERIYKGKEGLKEKANITFSQVDVNDYDGLLIPGGYAPDKLRRYEEALDIVREFNKLNKPIGMICHAGWVGISAGILNGVKATSTKAIKDDMVNAGVNWVDEAPVIDKNIITVRNPGDLHVYVKAFLEML